MGGKPAVHIDIVATRQKEEALGIGRPTDAPHEQEERVRKGQVALTGAIKTQTMRVFDIRVLRA